MPDPALRVVSMPRPVSVPPVLPIGVISPVDAAALLHPGDGNVFVPQQPIMQTLPVEQPAPGAPATAAVPVTTATATGAGLIAWAKANPVTAVIVASAAAWVIYELSKKR